MWVLLNSYQHPFDYQWSSAGYHCGQRTHDILVKDDELLSVIANWKEFLSVETKLSSLLEEKNRTGRPFGSDNFYTVVEKLTGFNVRPGKPGRSSQKQ